MIEDNAEPPELATMTAIYRLLIATPDEARARVLRWAMDYFGVETKQSVITPDHVDTLRVLDSFEDLAAIARPHESERSEPS